MKTANMSTKARILTFLMAFVLILTLLGAMMTPAYAASTETGNGIFDTIDSKTGKITKDGGGFSTEKGTEESIATVIGKYKTIATAITGILTITMLIFMLIQFTKLGAAGDNEMARKKAIMGILTTGIATALLGGATIVVGFFWNAINGTT